MKQGLAVLVLLVVAGCGWMEVPYESGGHQAQPRVTGTAPAVTPRQTASDPLFVGAEAVTVGRGDTVYAIAKRHKVNMRAVIDANGLRPPYTLHIGQKLVLPRPREYTVRAGDTLSGIANRFNVSLYQTAKLNGLSRPYILQPGQRLRLSATQDAQAAAVQAAPSGPTLAPTLAPTPAPTLASPAPTAPVSTSSTAAPTVQPPPPKPAISVASAMPGISGQGFLWPVQGKVLSSFGPKQGGVQNDGINIAAARGSAIKAVENGVVAYAGDGLKGFGQLVLVRHAGGWVTAYGHAESILVQRGDTVRRGQSIARVGSSGNVTTPQLHFQMRKNGRVVDPAKNLG